MSIKYLGHKERIVSGFAFLPIFAKYAGHIDARWLCKVSVKQRLIWKRTIFGDDAQEWINILFV